MKWNVDFKNPSSLRNINETLILFHFISFSIILFFSIFVFTELSFSVIYAANFRKLNCSTLDFLIEIKNTFRKREYYTQPSGYLENFFSEKWMSSTCSNCININTILLKQNWHEKTRYREQDEIALCVTYPVFCSSATFSNITNFAVHNHL